jgi:hypothetical protein
MRNKWIPGQEASFLGLTQPMLDYYALHENEFKGQRFESIAGCTMQLAAGRNRGCQKKFKGTLKGQGKKMFGEVKRIKDSLSYTPWKQIFMTVVGSRVYSWNFKGNLALFNAKVQRKSTSYHHQPRYVIRNFLSRPHDWPVL